MNPDRFRDLIRGFTAAVAEELNLPGEFSTWGISSILTVTLDGRSLRIGTNGTNYWLEAELSWQELTPETAVLWAPLGIYCRAAYLEGQPNTVKTGDVEFDGTYLIVGPDAGRAAQSLPPPARQLLVTLADLHLDISGSYLCWDPPHVVSRPRAMARPSLASGNHQIPDKIGSGRFTPWECASNARALASCCRQLEQLTAQGA